MTKLYIVAQSYQENTGSFSGFVEQLAKQGKEEGFDVTILCGKRFKKDSEKEKLPYAKVLRFSTIKAPFFSNVFNAILLAKKIKHFFSQVILENGDLIVANGEAGLGLSEKPFIIRSGDQPIRINLKNLEIAKKEVNLFTRVSRAVHLFFLYLIEKKIYPNAKAIICSSKETLELYCKEYGLYKKSYFIPHAGVKTKIITKIKHTKNEKTILFVSVKDERIRKGTIYLESALPYLMLKYPELKVQHVGEIFKWNIPSNLKNRIFSAGVVSWDEMEKYYQKADIFVSCSIHEMFPNTILEAMAHNLPVVSSDIQGVKEYLKHRKNSFIFKRGDVEGLIEGISFFMNRPEASKNIDNHKLIDKIETKRYYRQLLDFCRKTNKGEKMKVNLLSNFKP